MSQAWQQWRGLLRHRGGGEMASPSSFLARMVSDVRTRMDRGR